MLTRRLAVSACALSLLVPATAAAQSSPQRAGGQAASEVTGMGAYRIADAAGPVVVTGVSSYHADPTAGSPVTATGVGSYATTESAPSQGVVTGAGSYATAKTAGSQVAVTGLGTYNTADRAGSQVAITGLGAYRTDNPAHEALASNGGGSDGWQVAALSEAVLVAAFALGSLLILRGRRSAPGMGT